MEILNVIDGMEITRISGIGYLSLALLVIGFIMALLGGENKIKSLGFFGVGVVLASVILVVINGISEGTGKYYPKTYEVIITDPDYVIDAEKYIYVGKEGKIVTLQEVQQK